MPYKVLLSDKLAPEGIEILKQSGELAVDSRPGLDPAELREIIVSYDALVIRSGTNVTADIIAAAKSLKVIGRAGIGIDNVDVEAASKRGIVVMNTPGGNNVTTAEHTISLMLAMARHIPQANASLRAGHWKRGEFLGTELCNKVLGIVGTGNIGSIVADRAMGLKMKVIAHDPYVTEEAAHRLGIELVGLDELYARADFISVHTPLTADTKGLVSTKAFAAMKPGVRVINCARGGIIDEQALLAALEQGKVAGAALDVFTEEPPGPDNALVQHPRVVATPHLGASTGEAQLNVAIAIAEQVRDFLLRGVAVNAVNVPVLSEELARLLAPYVAIAEKIGSLYAQLHARAPSQIKIEYRGEIADIDCRPVSAAVLKGLLAKVSEPPVNEVSAPILAKERGIGVSEVRNPRSTGYANSVTVTFSNGGKKNVVEGAVFGTDITRLVRFDDFYFEAVPEGYILVLENRDVPGVVGRVGTFLAEHQINIAGFELGRIGGLAVSFVHVDSPLNATQIEAMRKLPDITSAAMVKL